MNLTRRFILSEIAIVVLMAWAPTGQCASPNPEALGPYPVGVTTLQLTDPSREDSALGGPRPLLAEIWYPAAESAKDRAPTEFMDFYMGGENLQMNFILTAAFKFDVTKINDTFKTIAVRDAEIAGGKFPLVIFSHGNGGMRAQNTFWCDHLASHGFIVAAVDHTHNACATSYEGKVIPYAQDGRSQAAIDRPKDVSFLIDEMGRRNGAEGDRLYGHVDLENIGVAGHSFGGFTSMAANYYDERVDAIAPMAAVVPEYAKASTKPLLLFIATEDDTIDEKGNASARAYFEATEAPKYLVELKDGGHYSFSDMYQINPAWGDGVGQGKRITDGSDVTYIGMEDAYRLTNGYSVAFFTQYLKGDGRSRAYLESNQDEGAILFRAANLPPSDGPAPAE